MLFALLDRLFLREEKLEPDGTNRWCIIQPPKSGRGMVLHLHHFVTDDPRQQYHSHPRSFFSIGLWGSYVDHYRTFTCGPDEAPRQIGKDKVKVWRAPWIRWVSAEFAHRITLTRPGKSCWTLVGIIGGLPDHPIHAYRYRNGMWVKRPVGDKKGYPGSR